jgi:hypothetical protein
VNSSPERNENIETISAQVRSKLKSLRNLRKAEKVRTNQDILRMIDYYQGITEKEKDRLTNLYNFALQILVICIAGVSLIIAIRNHIPGILSWMATAIFSIQILASVLMVYVHERQSGFRYPFLKVPEFGNKWKWFYYGNDYIRRISTNAFFRTRNIDKTIKPYLKGLSLYLDNYKHNKIEDDIVDNIQQAYLLQVHNYFKNRFFLSLIRIRLWSVNITFIVVALLLLFYILFPGYFDQKQTLSTLGQVI